MIWGEWGMANRADVYGCDARFHDMQKGTQCAPLRNFD
jgi:hypothetical protein